MTSSDMTEKWLAGTKIVKSNKNDVQLYSKDRIHICSPLQMEFKGDGNPNDKYALLEEAL